MNPLLRQPVRIPQVTARQTSEASLNLLISLMDFTAL